MRSNRETSLKLFVVLSRAATAVTRLSDADISRHGLSPGEFAVLEVLYHRGPLLLGEVQRKILASSGGVTYLVDRLEKQGYVERQDCPTDRRARYAALTPRGRRFVDTIFPQHAEAIQRAVAGLTLDEKRQAIELLRKLGTSAAEQEE